MSIDVIEIVAIGFIAWVGRGLFDNRDLKRTVLEPAFHDFETALASTKQTIEKFPTQYADSASKKLDHEEAFYSSYYNLKFACRKIQEHELLEHLDAVFKIYVPLIGDTHCDIKYYGLHNKRKPITPNEMQRRVQELERAEALLLQAYERYWKIISSPLPDFKEQFKLIRDRIAKLSRH